MKDNPEFLETQKSKSPQRKGKPDIEKLSKPKADPNLKIETRIRTPKVDHTEKIESRTKRILEEKQKKNDIRSKVNEPTFTPKINKHS